VLGGGRDGLSAAERLEGHDMRALVGRAAQHIFVGRRSRRWVGRGRRSRRRVLAGGLPGGRPQATVHLLRPLGPRHLRGSLCRVGHGHQWIGG
jgi:hypothetical protein